MAEPKTTKDTKRNVMKKVSMPKIDITRTTIAGALAGLVLGVLIGKFALGASLGNVTPTNATEVNPQQSSEIIATYVANGKSHTVTLEDMFTFNDSARNANEDGTYAMPTTEQIVSYVRQQIVQDAAAKSDVKVTEEDKLNYIKENYGYESMEDFAAMMNRTVEETDSLVSAALTQTKLFEKVAGEEPKLPSYPDAPEGEDADESAKTEDYAAYIIQIAGDDWKDGKWAADDFAEALPDFDGKTASYTDATAAYQVLYNRYTTVMNDLYSVWNEYENGLLKDCSITIGTLIQ